MKILILEQEKTILQSLSNFLERYNRFEVFTAHSQREGISLFETIPFDIILCGHKLPDGDGLQILKEWVKQKPKIISILMTPYSDDSFRKDALNAGIHGYLEKPFDLQQLEEALGISDFACLR